MQLIISQRVQAKLAAKEPPVQIHEIQECFTNRMRTYLLDTREEHMSDPPTRWFIAETHYGRKLKVAFILKDGAIIIRSAYSPNLKELAVYSKHSTLLSEE